MYHRIILLNRKNWKVIPKHIPSSTSRWDPRCVELKTALKTRCATSLGQELVEGHKNDRFSKQRTVWLYGWSMLEANEQLYCRFLWKNPYSFLTTCIYSYIHIYIYIHLFNNNSNKKKNNKNHNDRFTLWLIFALAAGLPHVLIWFHVMTALKYQRLEPPPKAFSQLVNVGKDHFRVHQPAYHQNYKLYDCND